MDGLRTRAGTLLAAAALVTSFLGGQALAQGRHPGAWAVVAVAAFILLALSAVVILLPWNFNWFFDPNDLVRDYVDDTPQMAAHVVLRDLALHHTKSRETNERVVRRLHWTFRAAALLLCVEVVAWLLALPGKLF